MPLFPASLRRRPEVARRHRAGRPGARPAAEDGRDVEGLCPFHGEKTPSFHVNGDKGFFHCFGCGVGGDVIKFVELHDKVTFPEAVRQLAARAGLTVPEAEDASRTPSVARARGAAQGARGGRRLVPRAARLAGRRARRGACWTTRHDRRRRSRARDGIRPGCGRPAARLMKEGFAERAAAARAGCWSSATTARRAIGSGTG